MKQFAITVLLSTFLLLVGITKSKAQKFPPVSEVKSVSSDILEFVSDLNNKIDSLFIHIKAARLNRNLGYFKNDLRRYLNIRKGLMEHLEQNNYDVRSAHIQTDIVDLKKRLYVLLYRLDELAAYVNTDFSNIAGKIIEDVTSFGQRQEIEFITPLEDLIRGGKPNKRLLRANARDIFKQLKQSMILVTSIQEKIHSML